MVAGGARRQVLLRNALLDPKGGMPQLTLLTTTCKRRRSGSAGAAVRLLVEAGRAANHAQHASTSSKRAARIAKRGLCEMDLIEGKGRGDPYQYFGPRGDWYWLALVDRLTGYGS